MKKWFEFFFCSFFSHDISKKATKRGYTNVFCGFILALAFLLIGFVGGDMLPLGVHYKNSPDFAAAAYAVFANADVDKRIDAEIDNGSLRVKKHGGEYAESLLVNTFERASDKQDYSVNGYNVVVDSRPSDALAEIEAHCVSNDGKNTVISYQDYLTLSEVAKLNFDFKLSYTGNELELEDESVQGYRLYVDGLSDENKSLTEKLANDLAENNITRAEYNRAIYELYFENYYPEISEYESTSKVPLLRNYYYHQYISKGVTNYLLVFDDYMMGSFETAKGIDVTFYGFYSDLENGPLVVEGVDQSEAKASVDSFIKESFRSIWLLNVYAYIVNIISLLPFIALMLMVATLLTYSILRLRGIESVASLGAMFKIVGAFVWPSGLISAVFSVIIAFFVQRNMISVLPLVLFFAALVIRSIIFAVSENKIYMKQSEQQETEQREV